MQIVEQDRNSPKVIHPNSLFVTNVEEKELLNFPFLQTSHPNYFLQNVKIFI